MTNEQSQHLKGYLTLIAFCDANESITAALPNFSYNKAALKSAVVQIQANSEEQKTDKKGITKGKNQIRINLIVLAGDNSRKLTAFAKLNNNQKLLAEVNYSETDFKRFSDTDLRDYVQIIYDRAQSFLSSLTNYEINDTSQADFLDAINAFNAALPTSRIGATAKSQVTKKIASLFKDANTYVKNMDTAVEIVRLSQVNFYNGYKTAGKIVGRGSAKLAAKCYITDSVTNQPLKGVTITFISNVEKNVIAKKQIVKKTAVKGSCNIKSLPEGEYKAVASKPGYKDANIIANITSGQMSVIDIKLEKK